MSKSAQLPLTLLVAVIPVAGHLQDKGGKVSQFIVCGREHAARDIPSGTLSVMLWQCCL